MTAAGLPLVLALACAAAEPVSSEPSSATEDTMERETRERLGSLWDSMSEAQRRCHVDAARTGRPAQYGDGTCESML